jgi:hypothetical protein
VVYPQDSPKGQDDTRSSWQRVNHGPTSLGGSVQGIGHIRTRSSWHRDNLGPTSLDGSVKGRYRVYRTQVRASDILSCSWWLVSKGRLQGELPYGKGGHKGESPVPPRYHPYGGSAPSFGYPGWSNHGGVCSLNGLEGLPPTGKGGRRGVSPASPYCHPYGGSTSKISYTSRNKNNRHHSAFIIRGLNKGESPLAPYCQPSGVRAGNDGYHLYSRVELPSLFDPP